MNQRLNKIKNIYFHEAPFVGGVSNNKMIDVHLRQYEITLHDGWLEFRKGTEQYFVPSANVKSIACEVPVVQERETDDPSSVTRVSKRV